MNPDTGAIAHFETDEDAKEAGYTVPLTSTQVAELSGMNRHDRRAWLAKNRKQQKVNDQADAIRLLAELEKSKEGAGT